MKELATRFPNLTNLYSVGKSVKDRRLYVLEISDNPGVHEKGTVHKQCFKIFQLFS